MGTASSIRASGYDDPGTGERHERRLMRTPRRLDPDRVVELLPRLYRAARAWTDSREEAEDLVQETCAQVLARPRLLYGEDERAYLLRALRNTLISQRRAAGRRPQIVPLEDASDSASAAGDPGAAAEISEIYVAIGALPDEFRDVLVAVDLVGLSYEEAARVLRVPEGTVTSRLFRARDRLAHRLASG